MGELGVYRFMYSGGRLVSDGCNITSLCVLRENIVILTTGKSLFFPGIFVGGGCRRKR